ncbi:MAG TPA: NifU family protein [Anaerolineales bacterium]|nr:NifU family protein [Anaerolineales bacterium]
MTEDNERKPLELTPAAVDKIAELIATRAAGPQAVRVMVQLGGASGGQSEFKFVDPSERTTEDTALNMGPFMIFLDPEANEALMNAQVDFDEKKYATGFHIEYDNPLTRYLDSRRKDWGEDPVASKVQDLVDNQINPGVAGHGGWVVLLDVKDDTAYIEMGGGCRGCAISQMTLKQGIERIITEEVPQIARVLDTTDHSEGENPYYAEAPAGGQSPF